MASAYSEIGAGQAEAALAVSKTIGVYIGLQHRTSLACAYAAQIRENKLSGQEPQKGRLVEEGKITFLIPSQPAISGFSGYSGTSTISPILSPSKPITVGDKIEYPIGGGRYFFVTDDVEQIANGYIYIVPCTEHKSITMGVRS